MTTAAPTLSERRARAAAEFRAAFGLHPSTLLLPVAEPLADGEESGPLVMRVTREPSAPDVLADCVLTTVRLPEVPAVIDYVNWRGERAVRRIIPRKLWHGETEHHAGPQWLLDAWDVEKAAERTFALADVRAWAADGDGAPPWARRG